MNYGNAGYCAGREVLEAPARGRHCRVQEVEDLLQE